MLGIAATSARVRALLELVPDLISVHRGGELIYCNLAARRMYDARRIST